MNYCRRDHQSPVKPEEPLFRLIEECPRPAATRQGPLRRHAGWVAHTNRSVARVAPIDGPTWGMCNGGAMSVAAHVGNTTLPIPTGRSWTNVYPVMRGAASSSSTPRAEPSIGYLVTNPSPVAGKRAPYGASVTAGPAMDGQILRDLFAACIQSARDSGIDPELRSQLAATRARFAAQSNRGAGAIAGVAGRLGQAAPRFHHRHVSHLWGLFPSTQISLRDHASLGCGRATLAGNSR